MAQLSITTAWNETVAFVQREGRLIFPVAFMLSALPMTIAEVLAPQPSAPGQLPAAGVWMLLFPIAFALSLIGNLAISYLALTPGISVAEAIRRGARRFLPLTGIVLLLVFALVVLFFLVTMVVVVLVPGAMAEAQAQQQGPAVATAIAVVMVILLPLLIYVAARLVVMTPVAAAEEGGPVALFRRSWSLTAGKTGKLAAFVVLLGLAVGVLTAAIEAVFGILFTLVAGPPRPGNTTALLVATVMTIVSTFLVGYVTTLIARIYAQLTGRDRQASLF